MANFLEFLKSGKSAREFIDTAVLPQHAIPVTKTRTSPEPYDDDEAGSMLATDIPTPVPRDLESDAGEPAHDIHDETALAENNDGSDDALLRQLEALEETQ